MIYLLPITVAVAMAVTVLVDGGVAFTVVLYGIAAASSVGCAFLDQDRLAFFGTRWSYRDEPHLSDSGWRVAQMGWLAIAAVITILGLVELWPYIAA